jgi:hypothetical protein
MKNGSIAIFIHESLQYAPINLEEFCMDQATEECAMKLHHLSDNVCILTVYIMSSHRKFNTLFKYFRSNMK